jgi:hypothetical protein
MAQGKDGEEWHGTCEEQETFWCKQRQEVPRNGESARAWKALKAMLKVLAFS